MSNFRVSSEAALVHQMSLTSAEYEKGVNEFVKAGLTEIPSVKIKPPRVKESPVQLECKVINIVELGENGGAGNLIICEIVMIHIDENIIDPQTQMIDQQKIDLVSRLGGDWYGRAWELDLGEPKYRNWRRDGSRK